MHLRVLIITVAVGLALAADSCSQYTDCQDCVSHFLCGWCSEPVVFPGNVTGPQCAGFNPSGHNPFVCNGIYSTEQCVQGYMCNKVNYTCDLAPPGSGNTLAKCQEDCFNHGHVYLCNQTDKKCYIVPPGTPNSASYASCEASCSHPSPHPAPPPPPPTPSTLYKCNYTSGQCETAPAGSGTSKEVCEKECTKSDQKYACNQFLHQCYKLPAGASGESLPECEKVCNPAPNPGPPSGITGTYRGIAIQNDYKIGEWDFNFQQEICTIVDVRGNVTYHGVPYHVTIGGVTQLWVKLTNGASDGQYWKAITKDDSEGPETKFMTAAFGAIGADAPASIVSAYTDGSSTVFALAKCIANVECKFTMPESMYLRHPRSVQKALDGLLGTNSKAIPPLSGTDPCMPFGASCAVCMSHPFCGWCSQNVTYGDGTMGSQCAGFGQNMNASDPFVCQGRYSTTNCGGYECNEQTYQCYATNSGNGFPEAQCEQICHPTPSPSPPPQQYVCNLTLKQCFKCNTTHCPGSMPQTTCEAACKHPHKGPTALVIGVWRGLMINNLYEVAEFEMAFNETDVTWFKNGEKQWDGSVTSLGGDVMLFDVSSGPDAGKSFSVQYSIANQGALYSMMTMAAGAFGASVPQSYETAMDTKGDLEYIFAKCNQAPCVFKQP